MVERRHRSGDSVSDELRGAAAIPHRQQFPPQSTRPVPRFWQCPLFLGGRRNRRPRPLAQRRYAGRHAAGHGVRDAFPFPSGFAESQVVQLGSEAVKESRVRDWKAEGGNKAHNRCEVTESVRGQGPHRIRRELRQRQAVENRLGQGNYPPFRREALTFMPMRRSPRPARGCASGCGQWRTKAAPLGPCAGLALTDVAARGCEPER